MLTILNARQVKGAPYHPQSQGANEKGNGLIKRAIEKHIEAQLIAYRAQHVLSVGARVPEGIVEWYAYLHTVTLRKNLSTNRTTGDSPFALYFPGRQLPAFATLSAADASQQYNVVANADGDSSMEDSVADEEDAAIRDPPMHEADEGITQAATTDAKAVGSRHAVDSVSQAFDFHQLHLAVSRRKHLETTAHSATVISRYTEQYNHKYCTGKTLFKVGDIVGQVNPTMKHNGSTASIHYVGTVQSVVRGGYCHIRFVSSVLVASC